MHTYMYDMYEIMCQVLFNHFSINSFNLQQPCELGSVVIFILQVGKLRHRDIT